MGLAATVAAQDVALRKFVPTGQTQPKTKAALQQVAEVANAKTPEGESLVAYFAKKMGGSTS
jgi:hypothetical protein